MTARRVDEVPADRPGHWVLPHWQAAGVTAGITDATLDLRLADRNREDAAAAWDGLRASLPGFRGVVVSRQVHGRRVLSHPVASPGCTLAPDADGHLGKGEGLLLGVTVADCVPVYLRHDPTGWTALLHAGWRGVASGILEAAIRRLAVGGAAPDKIIMHCGVSICGNCYEVGPEVHAAVESRPVSRPTPLDLRAVLAGRAREAGVRAVTVSGLCALEHPAFHSHRGSGGAPARMAAYLGRPIA